MNRTDFLTMREQLMKNIDTIVDEYCGKGSDELVAMLCDMVCETMDPAGLPS